MFEDTNIWQNNPKITGALFAFVLLSPIGAPTLGFLSMVFCDISFGGSSQCFVPERVLRYLIYCLMVPPFRFGVLGLAWLGLGFTAFVTFGWLFVRSLWWTVGRSD